ncbi:MAG TPA: BolA family protein [Kofleriaceae bacterium]|nr:BolA family protein [Kofleriaceae bacterium]
MSSHHHSGDPAPVMEAIRTAISAAIKDAAVEVTGGGGHYSIVVVSPEFEGKGLLASQRMVYAAITDLMTGDNAPVHAVDSLRTRTA